LDARHRNSNKLDSDAGILEYAVKTGVRARALAQMSTTPATPLRTPFAARLKTRLSETRLGNRRRTWGPGQSRLGLQRGVNEEEETETITREGEE
jgi:protein SFI1